MNLWIRSQSKLGLYKVDEVYIDKRDFGNNDIQHYIMTNGVTLGIYKTKERALEVLDEIQNILIDYKEMSRVVYQMPKE